MLHLLNAARNMATLAGFTKETAWPWITEVKNNLRDYHEAHYAYYFLEPRPGVRAPNPSDRADKALNLCAFLQTNNIRAVFNPRDSVIVFPGFDRSDETSRSKIIGLLDALEPPASPEPSTSKKPSQPG